MNPHILALSTVNPPFACQQSDIGKKMIAMLSLDDSKAQDVKRIYQNSAIEWRYSAIGDYQKERGEWGFLGNNYPANPPGMHARNILYKKSAPSLTHEAGDAALKKWGGDPANISHVICVSCTGVLAPGLEFKLIESLKLKRTTTRLGINFMGCFGAFKGLQTAVAFARENPKNRILLVCTELCTLHLQSNIDTESLLANSLFSDGIAAAVIGCQAYANENPLFSIIRQNSYALEETQDKMTWEAGDYGFLMTISSFVPVYIKKNIHLLTEALLSDIDISACDWAIHPGGKSILQAIERALQLNKNQTIASWEVLQNYGNMSSATFLFVLEKLSQKPQNKKWTVGLGFGPGLSMEGILLRNEGYNE